MDKRTRQITAGLLAAVALLVLALYWQGLNGPFVLDDRQNVVNGYLEDNSFSAVVYRITHNASGQLGRGVSVLSFIVSERLHGNEPWGYKFDNLLLHLLTGILMMRLLFLILPQLDRTQAPRNTLLVATLVGGLWLLHPLWVSTVLYVVQRMTQLAVLFTLLALLAYVGARRCPAPNARFHWLAWVVFPCCSLLALLSKETAVLIPLYLLAIEVLVFRSTWNSLKQQRHLALFLLIFVGLPLLVGNIYLLTHFDRFTNYEMRNFSLVDRLLTQLHVVFFYIRMILLPRVADMSLFHDDFPVTRSLDAVTLILLAALVLMLAVIWLYRTRAPVLAFGLAWFLLSHVLESTIIPLELVFEHRNYLAAMGLLLPLVYYATTAPVMKPARVILVVCLPLLFAGQTWTRAQEWSSEGMMFTTALADHPESSRARINVANYLIDNNQVDEAFAQLRVAQILSPSDPGPSIHLYAVQCAAGIRDAALLEQALALLAANPASVHAMNAMEFMLGFINREQCAKEALDDVERLVNTALAMPTNVASARTYGLLHRFLGMAYFMRDDYDKAVAEMHLAYETSGLVSLLAELVRYQVSLNRMEDANSTLALIEEVNGPGYGIETYTVESLRRFMAEAEASAATGVATEVTP